MKTNETTKFQSAWKTQIDTLQYKRMKSNKKKKFAVEIKLNKA